MRNTITAVLVMLGLALTIPAFAASPDLINYQGRLTDPSDLPLVGTFNVTFAIWQAPTGGTPDWTESTSISTDADGLFNVLLGSVNPLDESVFAGEDRYLGITVESDPEMPRQRLTAVPYAHRVGTVDGSTGGTISGEIEGTGVENKLRFLYQNYADLPAPGTWHGMFAHVHGEDAAYYAHSGGWVRLADSAHTHDAVGSAVSSSFSTVVPLPVGLSTIQSQSIIAPSPGRVIAIATTEVRVSHALGMTDEVSIDIQDNNLSVQDEVSVLIPGTIPTGNHVQGLAVHQSFVVPAGPSTFYLLGERNSGGAADVMSQGLTLLFVPDAVLPLAATPATVPAELSNVQRIEQMAARMSAMQAEMDALRSKIADE